MKIAVCDDEKVFRDEITEAIYAELGRLDTDVKTYENGKELLMELKGKDVPQVCFLDIEMPGKDGLSVAHELKKLYPELPIIFLTSHTERAMEGYEVNAFRFLAKPINREKLVQALNDLKEKLTGRKPILIRSDGEDVLLRTEDVLYMEAQNNSVRYVLKDEEYIVRAKLTQAEREIEEISDTFFRIHRGYVVNLRHVKRHTPGTVLVDNGEELPLARSAAAAFKEKLFEYVRGSAR